MNGNCASIDSLLSILNWNFYSFCIFSPLMGSLLQCDWPGKGAAGRGLQRRWWPSQRPPRSEPSPPEIFQMIKIFQIIKHSPGCPAGCRTRPATAGQSEGAAAARRSAESCSGSEGSTASGCYGSSGTRLSGIYLIIYYIFVHIWFLIIDLWYIINVK